MTKDFNLDERIADVFTAAPQYQANHVKQLILDTLEAVKPKQRDQFYGMICHDFSHCVPAYMDIESVKWWNDCLDQLDSNIQEVLKNPAEGRGA